VLDRQPAARASVAASARLRALVVDAVTMREPKPLPRKLVGCDPDTEHPYYAYFRNRELQSIHKAESPRIAPPYPRDAVLVIEKQFIAPGRSVSNDILDLAWAAGECSMHFDTVEKYSAIRWKGNVDKAVHQAWVDAELSDQERFVLRGLGKVALKEALDAVGIGLYRLRRMK
jgi:hypothetical protein